MSKLSPPAAVEVVACGAEVLDEFVLLLEEAAEWLWARDIRQWEPGSNRAQRPLFERFVRDGTVLAARDGGRLPLTITGADHPVPVSYTSPVASAQVKSAVLLAGLNTPGQTSVTEKVRTRDHTERMLRHFGATVEEEQTNEGWKITLTGQPELVPPPSMSPAIRPRPPSRLSPP